MSVCLYARACVCACKCKAEEVSMLECVFGVMKVFPAYPCPAVSLV